MGWVGGGEGRGRGPGMFAPFWQLLAAPALAAWFGRGVCVCSKIRCQVVPACFIAFAAKKLMCFFWRTLLEIGLHQLFLAQLHQTS